MKISAKRQINSPVQKKRQSKKSQEQSALVDSLQPEPLSSFIEIPLTKNEKDILVADNDEMSIIVIKAILEKNNFTFELASSENDAIAAFEKNQFHMVLIGFNDAIYRWENLVQRVWDENSEAPKTFLLALTNPPTEIILSEFLNNNFDKIILKPYKEVDLVKTIKKFKRLTPKRKAPLNYQSFSLNQLRRISNNNEVFVKSMLDKFIESAIECGETMYAAIAGNDIDKLKKAAHKGLPSYSILELKKLAELLTYFEQQPLVDADLSELKMKIKDFDSKNKSVISEIKTFLANS
jgi:DNA-binding response OmpR family regulator